ncbi:hypothetical protein [Psittacicella melopsittaci]|uniref:hypothetical protein n=1 Tax=Psittacicella melopsittaci TaxID=2028576 RepID=UPI0011C438CB|nr:hypothetical protein [Psittacicella melopsittaci]
MFEFNYLFWQPQVQVDAQVLELQLLHVHLFIVLPLYKGYVVLFYCVVGYLFNYLLWQPQVQVDAQVLALQLLHVHLFIFNSLGYFFKKLSK